MEKPRDVIVVARLTAYVSNWIKVVYFPSIVDKAFIKKVCVDDFALGKRFSYGMVVVDFESHRIIDMIPSRKTIDVSKWLTTFLNIQVVSPDP